MPLYDAVFFGILPGSPDPKADLKALGLDPSYARYSGTVAWGPGTGVADGALVRAIQANVGPFELMEFYLKRPERMWQRLRVLLPSALSLRPEFCGNFERDAGRFPGARSEGVAFWNWFHERCLSRIAYFLLCELVFVVVGGGLTLLFERESSPVTRRWAELAICLAACCLTAFCVAAFGDAWDSVKHEFLFNLLLDTSLVFGIVAALNIGLGCRHVPHLHSAINSHQ